MRKIPLTQGKFALVDDEDFERLNQWKWHAVKAEKKHCPTVYYAARMTKISNKRVRIWMHREIMQPEPTEYIDHKSHDGLDNKKTNLRLSTYSQNAMNRFYKKRDLPRGIELLPNNKYRARIFAKNKHFGLGCHENLADAIKAYNDASIKLHGEFGVRIAA